jgi:hypothetical protein
MIGIEVGDGGGVDAMQGDVAGALAVSGEDSVRLEAIGMCGEQIAAQLGGDVAHAAVPEQVGEDSERVGAGGLCFEDAAHVGEGAIDEAGGELIAGDGDAGDAVFRVDLRGGMEVRILGGVIERLTREFRGLDGAAGGAQRDGASGECVRVVRRDVEHAQPCGGGFVRAPGGGERCGAHAPDSHGVGECGEQTPRHSQSVFRAAGVEMSLCLFEHRLQRGGVNRRRHGNPNCKPEGRSSDLRRSDSACRPIRRRISTGCTECTDAMHPFHRPAC